MTQEIYIYENVALAQANSDRPYGDGFNYRVELGVDLSSHDMEWVRKIFRSVLEIIDHKNLKLDMDRPLPAPTSGLCEGLARELMTRGLTGLRELRMCRGDGFTVSYRS